MKPSVLKNQKRRVYFFFFFKNLMALKPTGLYLGTFFLITFEYLKSIVVDFVFSVSPLYDSNTPSNNSVGPAGPPQFQNSVYFYLSSWKQIRHVYLFCGHLEYTNLRHGLNGAICTNAWHNDFLPYKYHLPGII